MTHTHDTTCCGQGSILNPVGDLSTQQAQFNATYITAQQIAEYVGVSRVAVVNAVAAGHLPKPIIVGNNLVHIWEVNDVNTAIMQWRDRVNFRQQKLAAAIAGVQATTKE